MSVSPSLVNVIPSTSSGEHVPNAVSDNDGGFDGRAEPLRQRTGRDRVFYAADTIPRNDHSPFRVTPEQLQVVLRAHHSFAGRNSQGDLRFR